MGYSNWQLNRIRDALVAYYMYQSGNKDSGKFNWKDVSEAIEEDTGVNVPHEQLRKFAVGIQKGGFRDYTGLGPQRLEAVFSFVTDEDNYLLSKDELNEFMPSHQAALRLLEYLDQDFDQERMLPPAKLQGKYRVQKAYGDQFVSRELYLESISEVGIIKVIEFEEFYKSKAAKRWEQWSPQDRKRERNSLVKYAGWAILTPEDNLFFFLKNERNGMNRYYITMTAELGLWKDDPQKRLILLYHDFPLEVLAIDTNQKEIKDTILKQTEEKLMYFEKCT